jgi:hypothetical protein
MKKALAFVLVLVLAFAVSASAAKKMVEVDDGTPTENYSNCISTNIWPWLVGFYNIGYDRMIGSSFSVRPRASYVGWSSLGANFFAFGVDAFWHPQGKGIDGWFLGPRYDVWLGTGSGITGAMHFVGAMAGYNIVYPGGYVIQIALGAQKNIANTVSSSSGTLSLGTVDAVLPAFDLAMGWAF